MKKHIFKALLMAAAAFTATACNGLDGDNSDFDFEGKTKGESSERAEGVVRLATYNVHRCAPSGSNDANYALTGKAIGLLDADVVAIQELDRNTTTHPVDQVAELAKVCGMKPYFCKTIDYKGGDYGIGILSRTEPLSTYSEALPGVEQRAFFVAEFDDFVFVATHLCHKNAENRSWSYDIINNYLTGKYSASSKPVYLAGDLNDTALPSNCTAKFSVISSSVPTFWSSSSRIDYILLWKGNGATVTVARSLVPRVDNFSFYDVSDHLPMIVDIEK